MLSQVQLYFLFNALVVSLLLSSLKPSTILTKWKYFIPNEQPLGNKYFHLTNMLLAPHHETAR